MQPVFFRRRAARRSAGADFYLQRMLAAPSATRSAPAITHVAQVHCETGTGILNPLKEIATVVDRHGRRLTVDAMSSYGVIPIHVADIPFDALVAVSGLARYAENCAALLSGMRGLGFRNFLDDAIQAPIIVTFHAPAEAPYDFAEFYRRVRDKGVVLYPGKLTTIDTFRVGYIGAIDARVVARAVRSIGTTMLEMGIRRLSPDFSPGLSPA